MQGRPRRSPTWRSRDETCVAGLERGSELRTGVPALDELPCRTAEPLADACVPEQARDRVGEGRRVAGGDQHRVLVVGQHLGHHSHAGGDQRSEEHTSELQSQSNLVCRLLLEKKKKNTLIDCTTFCAQSDYDLRHSSM